MITEKDLYDYFQYDKTLYFTQDDVIGTLYFQYRREHGNIILSIGSESTGDSVDIANIKTKKQLKKIIESFR